MGQIKLLPKLIIYTCVIQTIIMTDRILDPFNLPKFWVLTVGAFAILVYLSLKLNFNLPKKAHTPIILLLVFIFAQLIVLFFRNESFYRGIFGTFGRNNGFLSYFSLCILMFAGMVYAFNYDDTRLIKVLSFLGFFESIYGIIQMQDADFFKWAYNGNKVFISLGNENFASIFLVLSILATIYMIAYSSSDIKKIGYFSSLILQLFILNEINTAQSRIALIVTFLIYMSVYGQNYVKGDIKKRIIFYSSYFFVGFFSLLGLLGRGPFDFINQNLGSLNSRYMHWIAGWNMFKKNVLFGVGLDSYGDYMPKFRILDPQGVPDSLSDNAHNLFVQLLATGGVLLFSSFLALFVYITFSAIKILKISTINLKQKTFYLSFYTTFFVNSIVGIDHLGVVQWLWLFTGLMIGLVLKSSNLDQRKVSKKDPGSKNNINSLLQRNAQIGFVLVGILIYVPSIYMISQRLIGEINIRNLMTQGALNKDYSKVGMQLYDASIKIHDPNIRSATIKYLFESRQDEYAFKLAKDTNRYFPRNLIILESMALYYEKYGNLNEAIKIREYQLNLDPLQKDFVEKLKELKSKLSNS